MASKGVDAYAFPALEGEPTQAALPREEALALAHARAEAAAAEAAARAREEGFAAGLADAEVQLEPARAALAEAIRELGRTIDEAAAETERHAVALAIALAEKIVHAALDADPTLVLSIVTGALRRIVNRDSIVVEVNPADVELVHSAVSRIEAELGALPRVEVAGERRIARGGCVVRTLDGEIDARLDQQLERAGEILRDSLAQGT